MRRGSAPCLRATSRDDAGDQRRLAGVAQLVLRLEPVPALRRVRLCGLLGIHHQEAVLVGQAIHLRARGEVVGRLGAAMQHHDHRARRIGCRRRHIDLVGPAAGVVAELVRLEAAGPLLRFTDRRLAVRAAASAPSPAGTTRAATSMTDSLVEARGGPARPPAANARRMVSVTPCIGPVGCRVPADASARWIVAWIASASKDGARALKGFFMSVLSVGCAGDQWMRSARARRTAGLAWNAPSTVTDSMAASASSGVTSSAMRASPTTWTCSRWPAATTVSRSARLKC